MADSNYRQRAPRLDSGGIATSNGELNVPCEIGLVKRLTSYRTKISDGRSQLRGIAMKLHKPRTPDTHQACSALEKVNLGVALPLAPASVPA